jgi:hypothetical protein
LVDVIHEPPLDIFHELLADEFLSPPLYELLVSGPHELHLSDARGLCFNDAHEAHSDGARV